MIWLVGGTTEGKECLEELLQQGYQVVLSVVSKTGVDVLDHLPNHPNLQVKVGQLGLDEMKTLVASEQIKVIIDATHPFAEQVSKHLKTVASQFEVPLVRVVRPQVNLQDPYVPVYNNKQLVQEIIRHTQAGERVFLALGANRLEQIVPQLKVAGRSIVARILPTEASITKAERAGLLAQDIVAIQGHGSLELNLALLREFDCKALVTKESGRVGGLDIKAQAASVLGIPLIVMMRPNEDIDMYCNAKEIILHLEKEGWSK